MTRRHFLLASLGAAVGLLALAGGAFVADPFGTLARLQEARLRAAGARVETFAAEDGSLQRVWEVGPLSTEVPVVLLHGLGAAGDYWAGTAVSLRKLGHTVLIPDAPGSGGSQPPRSKEGYGLDGRVAALRSLFEALGLTKVDLVGHSLGGWTAARFALEEPHRIRRLVLVDAGGLFDPAPGREEELRAALTPRDREGGRRLLDLLFFRKPFPEAGFVADAFARRYGAAENVVETVPRVTRKDGLVGRERDLPEGTVLIWGEKEALFALDGAREAASRIPKARLLVVTGVGHDGPLEAPRAFDEALAAALAGRPVSSR